MELTLHDAQVAYAEAIVEMGAVDLDAMNAWLGSLTETPSDLGEALCTAGLSSEFELTRRVAQHAEVSVASDIELDMYACLNPLIPRELCIELLMVPLSDTRDDPFPVALTNPFDEEGLAFLCEQLGVSALKIHLAEPTHIRHEISACYGTEEEWAAYLAELEAEELKLSGAADLEPELGAVSVPAQLPADVLSESMARPAQHTETALGAAGHPMTLPDWAHYDERGEASHAELSRLLRGV